MAGYAPRGTRRKRARQLSALGEAEREFWEARRQRPGVPHVIKELRGVIETLSRGRYRGEFSDEIADLEHSVAMLEGIKSENPPLATFGNPPELISQKVTRIEYEHAGNGQRYFHDFTPPVRMHAIAPNAVMLSHPTRHIVEDV